MLLNGFPRPRCWAIHSALRLHGIRSAPAPAMLIGVPFRYGIAAAPNLTPSSTEPSVHPSRRFLLAVATGLCVRSGGRSSGHKPVAGPRRGHLQRHHRGRRGQRASVRSAGRGAMMKPRGFLAGCCGWRTMEAIKRKAPPRVSHRSAYRRPRAGTASGRGCSFASNTASSTLLPLGVRVTILLAWYCAGSGLQWGVGEASQHHALTPCVASACGSAMYTALSVSLLVPHAKDKIVASWSGRCFDSSWRCATCAHSTRILELDVQKSRHALHSGRGVLISEAQWGRVAGAEESVPHPAGGCLHEVFSGPLRNGTQAFF
ncbi:hypothetical protein ECC02_008333 [Trypanosoma cruzi]|uniref:Uncharacterized protein n=1 Tax=Trypanosoma cruzi TaxID=5693 RepID=A0A7J6XW97_TRYCR|nr:hypothetical protein ECC02_008333 [Trypanosoma cruzi]